MKHDASDEDDDPDLADFDSPGIFHSFFRVCFLSKLGHEIRVLPNLGLYQSFDFCYNTSSDKFTRMRLCCVTL